MAMSTTARSTEKTFRLATGHPQVRCYAAIRQTAIAQPACMPLGKLGCNLLYRCRNVLSAKANESVTCMGSIRAHQDQQRRMGRPTKGTLTTAISATIAAHKPCARLKSLVCSTATIREYMLQQEQQQAIREHPINPGAQTVRDHPEVKSLHKALYSFPELHYYVQAFCQVLLVFCLCAELSRALGGRAPWILYRSGR